MRLKKLLMPVLLLGIIFTMGSVAFAQVACSIGAGTTAVAVTGGASQVAYPLGAPALPGASTNATSTGHTEPIGAGPIEIPGDNTAGSTGLTAPPPPGRVMGGGGLRVTCTNGATAGTGTVPGVIVLTISFGVPITNTASFPSTAAGIRLTNSTGDFVAAGPGNNPTVAPAGQVANVGISSINNSSGTIVVGLGTPVATAASPTPQNPNTGILFTANSTSTFDLMGVLVSVNGKTAPISATLLGTSNVAISTAVVPVITNTPAGLVDPTVQSGPFPAGVLGTACSPGPCSGGPAVLASNGSPTKGNFTLRIQENSADMFKSAAQFNGGATFPVGTSSSTQVNVVLSAVPTGLSIANCTASLTDTTGATNRTGGSPVVTPNNAGGNTLGVVFQTDVDQSVVDVLWVTCGVVTSGTATLPLPSAPVTAQVQLAPTGAALSSTGGALTSLVTGNIPRYQATLQPATGLTVVVFPPTSTTLLIPFAVVAPGINTGIAIANTSTDPFGVAGGGATPTAGTITFTMYPQAGGTPLTATTTSVASGSVYANNLSSILPTGTTSFTGIIYATANFPVAHGSATIYDTSSGHAELSTPVLVLVGANGGNVTSAAPRTSPEHLDQ